VQGRNLLSALGNRAVTNTHFSLRRVSKRTARKQPRLWFEEDGAAVLHSNTRGEAWTKTLEFLNGNRLSHRLG